LRFVAAWERDRPGTVCLIAPPCTTQHLPRAARQTLLTLRTPLDARLSRLGVYAAVVILRTILASVRMPPTGVAVASSHFFHDVIPCIVAHWRHGAMVAAFIYHVIGDMDRERTLRSALSTLAERVALRMLRRWGDVVFVDNEDVARSLRRRGFADDRIVMTANAFDPLVPLPPRVNGGPPVLAFCGRLVEEKGIWDVLELGQALAASAPSARIDMIGEGTLREAFRRRLSASGLHNIRMLGFVSEEDKWALLRRASLFVAPSREEGWGIAVGEALTAGTPVLAYDLPAYQYLGDWIERVPAFDTSAFVSTAQKLVSNPDVLARRQHAVEAVAARLPQWEDVLAAEFAVLRQRSAAGEPLGRL
jgi:glycosyltransferase involved in cell wall biosynthesis